MAKNLQEKILILSASVGGGHLRAAEAIELALRKSAPEAAVLNMDVLTLASKAFRRIYGKGYLDYAERAPHFLGYVYDLLDRPKDKEGEFEPDRLRVCGVDRERISVTGIPIHPVFSRRKERAEVLAARGLRGERPIVLLLSGGFGFGPIETILDATLTVELPIEVVVVYGRNEELGRKLARRQPPQRHRVKIQGYTTDIDEFMTVADLVISKPGGLTSAEVLARGSVLAIVNPIPGRRAAIPTISWKTGRPSRSALWRPCLSKSRPCSATGGGSHA